MPGPVWILALLAAGLLLIALVAAVLLRRPRSAIVALVAAGGAALAAGQAATVAARQASEEGLLRQVPAIGRPQERFVSSQTCRSCHPDEYASWHRSFHRTMTQVAAPGVVTGDFDDVRLESRGREYQLRSVDGEPWVEMVDPTWERRLLLEGRDPDREPAPPRVRRRVVMTTGSHHMQTYWVSTGEGNEVWNLPFVHLFEQDRWVPREDVFLRPPDERRFFAMWNNSCIDCHSTAGRVGFDFTEEVFDSEVAELGIACEACHGPAAEHIAANRDPLRRYRLHLSDTADPTIVQPERLDSRAASEVCGQCHAVSLSDEMDWLANGYRYRAGEELEASRDLVRPAVGTPADRLRELTAKSPTAIASRFWPDGMVRVSGREYSGMLESGCFQRGELSCLSCHSLHSSDPDDQLGAGMEGDEACLQCHDSYRDRLAQHTHHEPASTGSRCYNCHMPHTTYGLLSAIRSHWIDSPSAGSSVATGRPNACNLCHLDRPLAWTADHLQRWYGIEPPALAAPERSLSAALLWLLAGDAGQRALVAWSMGWRPALEASGRAWLAPYLAHLLNDPYATVRYIAQRSLRSQPRYRGLAYDFVGPEPERIAAREAVLERWFELPAGALDRTGAELLIDDAGNLNYPLLQELSRRRDDTPLFLAE